MILWLDGSLRVLACQEYATLSSHLMSEERGESIHLQGQKRSGKTIPQPTMAFFLFNPGFPAEILRNGASDTIPYIE